MKSKFATSYIIISICTFGQVLSKASKLNKENSLSRSSRSLNILYHIYNFVVLIFSCISYIESNSLACLLTFLIALSLSLSLLQSSFPFSLSKKTMLNRIYFSIQFILTHEKSSLTVFFVLHVSTYSISISLSHIIHL